MKKSALKPIEDNLGYDKSDGIFYEYTNSKGYLFYVCKYPTGVYEVGQPFSDPSVGIYNDFDVFSNVKPFNSEEDAIQFMESTESDINPSVDDAEGDAMIEMSKGGKMKKSQEVDVDKLQIGDLIETEYGNMYIIGWFSENTVWVSDVKGDDEGWTYRLVPNEKVTVIERGTNKSTKKSIGNKSKVKKELTYDKYTGEYFDEKIVGFSTDIWTAKGILNQIRRDGNCPEEILCDLDTAINALAIAEDKLEPLMHGGVVKSMSFNEKVNEIRKKNRMG